MIACNNHNMRTEEVEEDDDEQSAFLQFFENPCSCVFYVL